MNSNAIRDRLFDAGVDPVVAAKVLQIVVDVHREAEAQPGPRRLRSTILSIARQRVTDTLARTVTEILKDHQPPPA